MRNFKLLAVMLLGVVFAVSSCKKDDDPDQTQIPKDGLVAYYPFNGNAKDLSGKGNHGTVHGDVVLTTDRKGNSNSAYDFPGVAFNYISVPHNPSLALDVFTINAWIFTKTDYGYGQVVQKNRDIFGGHYGLYTNCVIGKIDYENDVQASSPENPSIGKWHMITGSVSGKKAKFYIDGVLMDESIATDKFVYSGSDDLAIGMHYYEGVPDHWTYPYKGKIDDIRIYNRVLSDKEIQALYNE
ncbi:MAG TPA: LamG domain-containing protein [Bacteroidales bacterium]|nr:LamG domain-containing protein [Bacteroidales bacterium]HOH22451.1 LamG domain-containing protein [Bacteroidales bacterium]HPB56936.1 LamG domain-containing protein [Bacteroidales bacterium]